MLLSAIDLIVFLSLAAQFAIAGLLPLPGLLVDRAAAGGRRPAGAAGRAAARAGPDPGLQRAAGRRARAGRRGGARLAARAIDHPAARRQHRHHLRHRRPRRGPSQARRRGRRPRPARRPRRLQGRRTGGGPALSRGTLRRGVRCRLRAGARLAAGRHGGDPGRAEGCFRADQDRVGQWRAQLADPRPASDAGCPFRRRAGRPRPPRRAVPVQRHRRHLAPRRGRGGGRLVARHPVGGSRPGAAHAPQGLARRVPDGAARDGRAAQQARRFQRPAEPLVEGLHAGRAQAARTDLEFRLVGRGQVHDHRGAGPAAHLSGAGRGRRGADPVGARPWISAGLFPLFAVAVAHAPCWPCCSA